MPHLPACGLYLSLPDSGLATSALFFYINLWERDCADPAMLETSIPMFIVFVQGGRLAYQQLDELSRSHFPMDSLCCS